MSVRLFLSCDEAKACDSLVLSFHTVDANNLVVTKIIWFSIIVVATEETDCFIIDINECESNYSV